VSAGLEEGLREALRDLEDTFEAAASLRRLRMRARKDYLTARNAQPGLRSPRNVPIRSSARRMFSAELA
jgi:hypothetical protein